MAQEYSIGAGDMLITVLLVVLFAVALLYTIYRIYRHIVGGPRHIENYFEANFRTLMDEWDLVTRPRLGKWKSSMSRRLKIVGKDIKSLELFRSKLDKRIDTMDRELGSLEEI